MTPRHLTVRTLILTKPIHLLISVKVLTMSASGCNYLQIIRLISSHHNMLVLVRHYMLVTAQHDKLVLTNDDREIIMPKPNEKLAESLAALQELQKGGRRIFRSRELSRTHRERLLRNGFLREVMKGWLMASSPRAREGDSTPWYASFWEFCASYCQDRFGGAWHLSPEQSLLLHAQNTVIPKQMVVYSPKGTNHTMSLLFGTSLYDLKQPEVPSAADVSVEDGLRLYSPAAALVKAPEAFFARNPIETQVVLVGIRDASDVLRHLLDGGRSAKAGQLAGAFRRIGRPQFANEIVKTMKSAGYDVREFDPFAPEQSVSVLPPAASPIVGRMQAMWDSMRRIVVETFPKSPGLPRNRKEYLRFVDDIYKSDAYHSLSIEGYSVTPALIERVQRGDWDPGHHDDDRQNRDALAARGYWQAFQKVKDTVGEVIAGGNAGGLVRTAHKEWYRELFQPCCGGWPDQGRGARGLPERCGLSAHVAVCTAAMGSGARCHAGAVRSAGA